MVYSLEKLPGFPSRILTDQSLTSTVNTELYKLSLSLSLSSRTFSRHVFCVCVPLFVRMQVKRFELKENDGGRIWTSNEGDVSCFKTLPLKYICKHRNKRRDSRETRTWDRSSVTRSNPALAHSRGGAMHQRPPGDLKSFNILFVLEPLFLFSETTTENVEHRC